jgi:hypothetical protein
VHADRHKPPKSETLHPTPYTCTHYTHPSPYTGNPNPETRNAQRATRNRQSGQGRRRRANEDAIACGSAKADGLGRITIPMLTSNPKPSTIAMLTLNPKPLGLRVYDGDADLKPKP